MRGGRREERKKERKKERKRKRKRGGRREREGGNEGVILCEADCERQDRGCPSWLFRGEREKEKGRGGLKREKRGKKEERKEKKRKEKERKGRKNSEEEEDLLSKGPTVEEKYVYAKGEKRKRSQLVW